ncbi:MAG TPA: pyridoxamine 5'-phosphate oxidase family protein [Rhodoglobus sp.]|nr:pyridoxamine 5'-phosphate oxidase family protein [Rhodoglobus sp.]
MSTHAMRAMLPPNAEGRSEAVALVSSDDCWRLLAKANLGRIAVQTTDGLDIFPINYVVTGEEIFFRSAPGSKLADIAANPVVAFEVDGRHGGHRWSVVVKGTAHRLDRDDMIESSGVLRLPTANSTEKFNYVRIIPTSISGRRIR